MQKDMTRRLVEIGVRSALTQCGGSPGRAVRNLVDLGLTFSRGQLQRQLLTTIQTLLGNPDSAYYPLIRDVVANTDTDRLVRFGVNVGYESCSKGARRLRTVEEEQGFHMPWALGLTVDGSRPAAGLPRWQEVIRQANALGVHTFLLDARGDAALAAALPGCAEESAFVLFLSGSQVTPALVERLQSSPNVLPAVRLDGGAPAACARLRKARFPYAVWDCYRSGEGILDGRWLESLLPQHPILAVLRAEEGCPDDVRQAVTRCLRDVRKEQRYPVVAMELRQDLLWIDEMISQGQAAAWFDAEGEMHTADGPRRAGPLTPAAKCKQKQQVRFLPLKGGNRTCFVYRLIVRPVFYNGSGLPSGGGGTAPSCESFSITEPDTPTMPRLSRPQNCAAGMGSRCLSQRRMAQTSASRQKSV